MKTTKKDRPEAATSERQRPGACKSQNESMAVLYQNLGKMQAQIRTGEEVFSRVLGICAHDHRGRVAGGPVLPAD